MKPGPSGEVFLLFSRKAESNYAKTNMPKYVSNKQLYRWEREIYEVF